MKLIVKKGQSQTKGVLGEDKGIKFFLSCQIELTPDEQRLIAKYKVENETLAVIQIEGHPKLSGILYLKDLVAGKTYEYDNASALLYVEDEIKKGCDRFKKLLNVRASFSGEEVIEYR